MSRTILSKKVFFSILSGLLCLAFSPLNISFSAGETTINIPWAMLFPIIVSTAYGRKAAIISSVSGAVFFPLLLWPGNGYASLADIILFFCFYYLTGYIFDFKRENGSFSVSFIVRMSLFWLSLNFLTYLLVFPILLKFNPPFWTTIVTTGLPRDVLFSIAVKNTFNLLLIFVFAISLLRLPHIRKQFNLPVLPYMNRNTIIFINSIFIALLTWLVFFLLDYLLIDQKPKHYLLLLLFVLVSGGSVVSLGLMYYSELRNKSLFELENHKNNLQSMVKEQTCELEAALEEWKLISEEVNRKNALIQQQLQELESANKNLADAQNKLLQSEKLAALGILTSGIAHEINNPLNYIMGAHFCLSEMLRENNFTETENIKLFLDSIFEGITRIESIIKNLVLYSQAFGENFTVCNVNDIVDNSISMLDLQQSENIQIEKKYGEQKVMAYANPGMLSQVFTIVLDNAVKAIKEKGFITIQVGEKNEKVEILVRDTGCGIEPSVISKVIDPFFTTKEPGKGVGLGLAIAHKIISDHKGSLTFESELGKGTTVLIELPLANQ